MERYSTVQADYNIDIWQEQIWYSPAKPWNKRLSDSQYGSWTPPVCNCDILSTIFSIIRARSDKCDVPLGDGIQTNNTGI